MKKRLISLLSVLVVGILVGCTATDVITDDIYTRGDIYIWDGGAWVAVGAGGGAGDNVTGPAVSTDHAVARWDGVGGNTLQDSPGVTIDDFDNLTVDGDIGTTGDVNSGNDLNCVNDLDVTDDADVGGDLVVVGSVRGTYIDIPEAAEPGALVNILRLFVTDEEGFSILSFKDGGGMVRQVVRDSVFVAYNNSGNPIAAARIVYASGSTGTVPEIALARANDQATMPAIGVTIEAIANGAYGRILQVGLLEDVNTAALAAGDILYVSEAVAGVPTITPPEYPNIRQEIGTVLVDHAATGAIQIVARTALDNLRIPITDFDAKGDLLTATADNVTAILPVGADTFVLTANSAVANGIEWAAPAAGGISSYTELDGSVVTTADALGAGDGAWIDWDLSATLPMGTVAADILIQKLIATDDVGVRRNGSGLARTTNTLKSQALTITAEVGADRILEIMSADVSDLDTFALMGYWD